MEIDTFIIDAFEDWLSAELTPAHIRAIEAGQQAAFSWNSVADSGFADLLVPEEVGGGGANLPTAGKFASVCGRHALPLPLAFTAFARAALAEAGLDIPEGPITFGKAVTTASGAIVCRDIPFGAVSEYVFAIAQDGCAALLPSSAGQVVATGSQGSGELDIEWNADAEFRSWPVDLLATAAAITSALMAGAADRVLDMALKYASERRQFGKNLASFQAIQQNLATLAEEVVAVRISAEQAFSGEGVDLQRAAVAKARSSKAVPAINAVGHLVHGAIGVTAEYDLQLYTRRLAAWRLSFGGERYWSEIIGKRLLTSGRSALPFLMEIAA